MRIAIALALMASLAACGKKDKDKPAAGSAAAGSSMAGSSMAGSSMAGSDTMAGSADPGSAAPGSNAGSGSAAAAGSGSAEAVDVCALASKADIEKAVGPVTNDPKTSPPNGAVMGSCMIMLANRTIMIDARPAGEFEASAGKGNDVPGIGEKAIETDKKGLFVKVAGKPYFLHITALAGRDHDNKSAAAIGKLFAK